MKKALITVLALGFATIMLSCDVLNNDMNEIIQETPSIIGLTGYVMTDAPASLPGADRITANQLAGTVPVMGAFVRVQGTNLSAETNSNGFFSIRGVPQGIYKIVIEYTDPGGTVSSTVVSGVNVPGGGNLDLGHVLIFKTGAIEGTITLEGSSPGIRGVVVFIAETNLEAITDSAGNYSIPDIPEGTYTLAASSDGYCAATVTGVAVTKDTITSGVDMDLSVCAATGSLTGFVNLPGSADNSGVLVTALGTAFSTATASDGSWTLSGLPTGAYDLRFSKIDYSPVTVNNILVVDSPTPSSVVTVYLLSSGADDNDGDGIKNADDPDDDNDGVPDLTDAFPFDPTEQVDTDSDGIGNNADLDDDNDGFSDLLEIAMGTDPLDPSSFPAALAQCSDGNDNDGDTFTDWPDDPECTSAEDPSELVTLWQIILDPGTQTVTTNSPFIDIMNVAWNGTDTFDFDARVKWTDPTTHIENVSLRVVDADSVAMNATILTQDIGTGTVGNNLPGVNPGLVYVADSLADGPESWNACDPSGVSGCNPMHGTFINAECGTKTAEWIVSEPSGSPYSFWVQLFKDAYPVDLPSDPRYDPGTASIYLRTHKLDAVTPTLEAEETHQIAAGEWFYVHFYLDYPGNNRPLAFDTSDAGAQEIEDSGNVANWSNGVDPYADYWYMQYAGFALRFDPAVIEVNSSLGTIDPPGNGFWSFMTGGTDIPVNTKLKMLRDPNTTSDLMDFSSAANQASLLASNMMGVYKQQNSSPIFPVTSYYANPCGRFDIDPNSCSPGFGTDSFNSIDWDLAYVPLHAKASVTPGTGSPISIQYNNLNQFLAARTMGLAYAPSGAPVSVQRSANWPTDWCGIIPRSACPADGEYNGERTYICVQ